MFHPLPTCHTSQCIDLRYVFRTPWVPQPYSSLLTSVIQSNQLRCVLSHEGEDSNIFQLLFPTPLVPIWMTTHPLKSASHGAHAATRNCPLLVASALVTDRSPLRHHRCPSWGCWSSLPGRRAPLGMATWTNGKAASLAVQGL